MDLTMDYAMEKLTFLTQISPRLHTRRALAIFALTFASVFLIFGHLTLSNPAILPPSKGHTQRAANHNTKSAQNPLFPDRSRKDIGNIPNIIHFVHFMLPEETTFDLRFREWVAIYSAHYYMNPKIIYIHTNVPEKEVDDLLQKSNSPWTQALTNIPEIKFNYHEPIEMTSNSVTVDHIAHKTDFARLEVLVKFGGIYLDDDSYILRPLHQFRSTGFENVMGLQADNLICPSAILSTKNNKFTRVFLELMDTEYDTSWVKHSVELMTILSVEFSDQPHTLLRLPHESFFPYSWNHDDLVTIYQVHDRSESAGPATPNKPVANTTAFIEHFQSEPPPETWHVDWRTSYILHGWNHMAQEYSDHLFGVYKDITFSYVMARSSNFARAVYPSVKHAWDSGMLDHLKTDSADDDATLLGEDLLLGNDV